jgi:hypothetical protein
MAGFLRSSSGYRILLAPPKGKRDLAGLGGGGRSSPHKRRTRAPGVIGSRCRSAQAIGDDGCWLDAGRECRPSRDAISGNIGSHH